MVETASQEPQGCLGYRENVASLENQGRKVKRVRPVLTVSSMGIPSLDLLAPLVPKDCQEPLDSLGPKVTEDSQEALVRAGVLVFLGFRVHLETQD